MIREQLKKEAKGVPAVMDALVGYEGVSFPWAKQMADLIARQDAYIDKLEAGLKNYSAHVIGHAMLKTSHTWTITDGGAP